MRDVPPFPRERLPHQGALLAWSIVFLVLPIPVVGLIVTVIAWSRTAAAARMVRAFPGTYEREDAIAATAIVALVSALANAVVTGILVLYLLAIVGVLLIALM